MKEVYRDLGIATGTHAGATSPNVLKAKDICFSAVGSVNRRIRNETDGSSGIVRSSTWMDSLSYSTVTATLSGGTKNNWELGDSFRLCITATYNQRLTSTEVGRMSGLAYPKDEMIDGELPGWDDIPADTMDPRARRR